MATPSVSTSSPRYIVYVVFVSLVIDLLGFTVILPLLPKILDYYSEHDKYGLYPWLEDKISVFQTWVGAPPEFNKVLFGGAIGSLFSFLQFMSAPMVGALSDVYGRKPVLLVTMVGVAASYVIWAISHNFLLFVLARVVGGISKGNVGLSAAIVTDVSTNENRGKGMALIGIAFSVGFIVGPMIGAIFSAWGQEDKFFVLPAIYAFVLAVADIAFLFFFLDETLPPKNRAKSIGLGVAEAYHYVNPLSLFTFHHVNETKKGEKEALKRVGLVYFLYLFLYSGLEYSLSFLTHIRFQYTSMQQGKMYLFCGLVMSVVQGGYVRRSKPGTELALAKKGLLLVIPAFIVMGFSQSQSVLYVGLALYSFASATVVPCLTTLVSSCGSVEQKGVVLGIFRSLGALARAVGPFVAAAGYWSMGPTLCYCIGGILLFLPYYLLGSTNVTVKQED